MLISQDVTLYTLAILALVFGYYVNYVIQVWKGQFAGNKKVKRTNETSPSNKQRPDITKFDDTQAIILGNAEKHDAFSRCELIANVKEQQKNWKESSVLQERSRALPFHGALQSNEKAEKLDMDHIYIHFLDFLWGYCFIAPMTYLLYLKGVSMLKVRAYLYKRGLLKVEEADLEALIGIMCLEQSQVINYFAKTKKGSKLGNVAGFFFSDFPYVDNNVDFRVADLFAVDIDLDTKRFVKAKLNDVDLTPSQTFILLSFNTISGQHVKLHAMANWGINDDPSLKETNPFLRRNSVVTAMYNFFGYSNFSNLIEGWESEGILSNGWSEKGSLIKVFNHGIKEGVGQHGNITELMRHSRFVNFSVKVRVIFINEFARHKHLFPGIDGEAFFVGTVLHSLDHTLLEWNVADPLWLDIDDPKFGKMAELTRIVLAGFTEDLPFLYFNKRFSGSDHPFYKRVYEKAAKIDKELADHMDTCIIK